MTEVERMNHRAKFEVKSAQLGRRYHLMDKGTKPSPEVIESRKAELKAILDTARANNFLV